ncbi:hypothetical protein Sgly_0452 [Syntrophobotulus glycolicus DSM 8271]|uniref:Uncharacterized protein n=1 Tax=Syntrophobotulus glycolicus (strain DSM 8271 / FlGlyR) TaxID=645991 RepID=F0SYL7_SYNGF|nr:hypothetical protein [Syntrophobotulus glycolicus]ADY54818.1 hypothetical protein Sgly_0452 [Syntrophobotulus glycolicus DSM 8271]
MALWQKLENDPEIRIRRYLCPECGSYTLHVKHEGFGECENGCFITDSAVINKVIDDKKFEGTFSEDELKYRLI